MEDQTLKMECDIYNQTKQQTTIRFVIPSQPATPGAAPTTAKSIVQLIVANDVELIKFNPGEIYNITISPATKAYKKA
jgi:hypothetical protein